MGLILSQNLTTEAKYIPNLEILPQYMTWDNYISKPYYFNNPNDDIKKILIENEIWSHNTNKGYEQIDKTINFITLLSEKDVVNQIKRMKDCTNLDIDNLTVIYKENSYLIRIPVKDLDNVFVELVV